MPKPTFEPNPTDPESPPTPLEKGGEYPTVKGGGARTPTRGIARINRQGVMARPVQQVMQRAQFAPPAVLPERMSREPDWVRDFLPQEVYWNDPGRVARFYDVLRTQTADWEAPPWMDVEGIVTAYEYFKLKNENKPWTEWKPFGEDDPVMGYLSSIAEPPADFMMPQVDDPYIQRWKQQAEAWATYTDEMNTLRQQMQVQMQTPGYGQLMGSWDELPFYQQLFLTLFSAQPGLEDRPEWTRGVAALVQGAMAGLGAGAIAGAIAPPAALPVGLGVIGLTAIQAFTGKRIPVLAELLTVMDLGAIAAERAIGLGKQVIYDKSFSEIMENFGAAWQAADLTYETQKWDLLNLVAPLFGDEPAGPGEVWQIQRGLSEPQPLAQGGKGAEALAEYRERLKAGEDPDMLYLEFIDRFGFSGTLNDFVMQTVLDPANLAPYLMGRAGASTAKLAGHARLAAALEAGVGNPLVDIAPFGTKKLVSMITGGKESQGLLSSLETYRRNVQSGVSLGDLPAVRASDLTSFEKWMGGLTQTGELKELQPGKTNWLQRLTTLTPEAQARLYMNIAEDHVGNLVGWLGEGDPDKMVNVLERMAEQARPGDVGKVVETVNLTPDPHPASPLNGEVKVGEGGEAIPDLTPDPHPASPLNGEVKVGEERAGAVEEGLVSSPAVATIASGIRQAILKGKPRELLTQWHAASRQRTLLLRMAKALGETPGRLLESIENDAGAVWGRLMEREGVDDIKAVIADADALRDTMGVFLGKDPMVWHPDEFGAVLTKAVTDDMRGFAAERFGVKPEGAAVRMSNVLKGMQSLLLLGFNPGYFVNNAVNNLVTRAAQGVFGFMTPKQVERLMGRLEMHPARMDVGVGVSGEMIEPSPDSHRTLTPPTPLKGGRSGEMDPIAKAAQGDDLIAKVQRQVNRANQKLGIFGRLSAAVERSESRNAYAIGIRQMYKKLWRRGVGFERMPKGMEAMLESYAPGISERIYAAVEAGMNMKEIEGAVFAGMMTRRVGEVKRQAAETLARGVDPARRAVDAAVMEDLVDSLGITDELESVLERAETPEDVELAFDRFERRLDEYVDEIAGQEMENLVEDVKTRVQAEGNQAVLQLFVEMQVKMEHRWLQHFAEWEETMSEAGRMGAAQKNALIRAQQARDKTNWKRINTFELQVMKAMIESLEFEKDLSRVFIEQLVQRHQLWNEFYLERNRKYREFFENTGNMSWEESRPLWIRLMDEMQALYTRTNERTASTQESMDAAFAEMMEVYMPGSRERVLAWRKRVLDAQNERSKAMKGFRAYIDPSTLDASQRRAEWTHFITREYNKAIGKIRQVEVEGATEVLGTTPTDPHLASPSRTSSGKGEGLERGAEEGEGEMSSGRLIAEMLPEYRDVRAGRTVGVQDLGHALNIINRYNGEGTTYEDILSVPVDVARRALDAWRDGHRHETVGHIVQMRLAVDDILKEADRTRREALLRSRGLQGRKDVQAQLRRQFPEVSEAELAAAMLMVDERARLWAKEQGLIGTSSDLDEAIRDAYYASRFGVEGIETRNLGETSFDVTELIQSGEIDLGPRLTEFYHDAQGAIKKLIELESGDAVGALYHPDVGDIDLVWGKEGTGRSDGLGLAKIVVYHPEVVNNLQEILSEMQIVSQTKNRIKLASETHEASARLDWDGVSKRWLLTAYQKETSASARGSTLVPDSLTGEPPSPASGISDTSITDLETGFNGELYQSAYNGGKPLTAEELANLDFRVPEGGGSKTPRRVMLWRAEGEEFETIYDLARQEDSFRFTEALGKGYERSWENSLHLSGKIKNNEPIKIYRAADTGGILPGAYVSESKAYALMHAEANITGGEWRIFELEVYPDELMTYGDPHEFIYIPRDEQTAHKRYLKQYEAGEFTDLNESLEQTALGSVRFMEDGRAVVRGFAGGNISTLVDEVGHIFRRDLKDADLRTMLDWANSRLRVDEFKELEQQYWSKDDTLLEMAKEEYVRIEEQFARGWERYLADGVAPNTGLRRIFNQFKNWMLRIYKQIRGSEIDVELSPEMRRVFDRLVSEDVGSFEGMVSEQAAAIQEGGSARRMSYEAVSRLAKEQVLDALLGEFKTEEDLLAAIKKEQEEPGSWVYEAEYDLVLEAAERMREEGIRAPWQRPMNLVPGKRTVARSTLDPRITYEFEYAVVEAKELITSDDWRGDQLKPNPQYDQRLQERSRDQAGSVQQADMIAARLVPEELIQETSALDRGAPIIGADGMVESGNGRTIAIKRAITSYPENYQLYKTRLMEMAPEMGIDPDGFAGMDYPVLVRVRKSQVDRVAFAREGNASVTLEKTVSETARNDARKITAEMLKNLEVGDNETIENALLANRNNAFVQQFLNKLNPNERNSVSENGVLNANGIRRMIHAILAAVFTSEAGERMRDTFINSVNVDVQAARTAIYQALPQVATAEGMMKMGVRADDLSITNDLAVAVNTLADIRNNPKVSLSDYLNQMTLIAEGELTPDQKVLLRWIGEAKGNVKRIREVLREYARIVIENEPDPNQGDLFGGTMSRTKGEVIDAAIRKVEQEYGIERAVPDGSKHGEELTVPKPGEETDGRGETTEDQTPAARANEAKTEAEQQRMEEIQARWNKGQPLTLEEAQSIRIDPTLMGSFGKEYYRDLWWPSKNMTQRYPQMEQGVWFVRSKPVKRGGQAVYGAVFMDGSLVALTNFSGHYAFETAQGKAVMLGTDPGNARQWVYLLTESGEIGRMDLDAQTSPLEPTLTQLRREKTSPALTQRLPPEQVRVRERRAQEDLFGQGAEDLPLFSGTPVRVKGERFSPREEARQMTMFPEMIPAEIPQRIVEITVIDETNTAHYKVPLNAINTIKRIERTNRNADVHYAVMDQRGKVLAEGENLTDLTNPDSLATNDPTSPRPPYPPERGAEEGEGRKGAVLLQEVSREEITAARERNLTDGKAALETAINEKRDVERAFLRHEIGEIDLVWGEEGDPQRNYKGGMGLSHIIAKRNAEGIDGEAFARSLFEVIADGEVQPAYTVGGDPRQIISKGERVVVLSLMEYGKKRIWVLTGFIDKKISGAPGEVSPSSGATSTTPSFSRRDRGAEIKDSLAQEGDGFKPSGATGEIADQVVDSSGAMLQAATRSRRMQGAEGGSNVTHTDEGFKEANPVGEVPLGETPVPLYEGEMLDEVAGDYLGPMIRQMRHEYMAGMERQVGLNAAELPETGRAELGRYLKRVRTDMASTKLAALRYGEQMRDGALLNYERRYGFDNFANVVFPYQFWYTRSIGKWAQRMIDRPAWFAMYARMKEAQERMEMQGVPSRFKGKMRVPAPFLPEWMGGGLWMDPLQQLFPFAQFSRPFDQMAQEQNQTARRADTILQEMAENGQISAMEMQEAMQTQEGATWESAYKQAELETDSEVSNPASLVSMVMTPALWVNIPMAIANGKPEKISTLPITRAARVARTALQGTKLEWLGNLVGLGAMPEETLRKMAGLNTFGEWGDYYIDRQIANLAADGEVSVQAALMAMIEHSGEAYDLAYQRVAQEEMVRMPGGLALNQLGRLVSGDASLKDVMNVPVGLSLLFGSGLLPEGELKLRELNQVYNQAWNDYNAGDSEAITRFYDEHPEYEARLALWKEPEERLQQFLIGEIWDRYFELSSDNRRLAAEQLGSQFESAFLNKTTRAEESVDVQMLAYWSQMLGGMVPRTEATRAVTDLPSFMKETIQVYPDEVVNAIEAYREERERLFPNIGMLQDIYFEIPETEDLRGAFVERNPDLQNYWEWKEQLFMAYPEVRQEVEAYQQLRDGMYPGIFDVQDGYFALPEGSNQRRQYLKANPGLGEYWDWKKQYYATHPALTWFETERERLFPDYARLTELYNLLPETNAKRKAFVEENPELMAYWDWKEKYEAAHAELQGWFAERTGAPTTDAWYASQQSTLTYPHLASPLQGEGFERLGAEELAMFSSELIEQLVVHVYAGEELSSGAMMALEDIWVQLGEPGGDLDVFLEEIVVPSMF